jgi:Sulfatase
MLPIPDRPRTGLITCDGRDPETKYPATQQLRPPKGAANILVIMLDDAGFGSSSAFGRPCQTPSAERLAAGGLKYNRFHTTALSVWIGMASTRAAIFFGGASTALADGARPMANAISAFLK